jgi:hypothetical protein
MAGAAVIMGELTSYNGTTAVIETWDDPPDSISFTATLNNEAKTTLTVSGLSGTVNGFDTANFNGTYTKQAE